MSGRRPGARSRTAVVVTGGGTAGHALPAIAIADALVAGGLEPSRLRLVGARRGIEARLAPEAGYAVVLLPGRGVERRVSLRAIAAVASLFGALGAALVLLARDRPQVVVTVGGYAGAPASFAAVLLRIPLLVVSLDAVPGAANRLVARFAARCAVAFEDSGLPRSVLTGAPVRAAVVAAAHERAARDVRRRALGVAPERRLLVVVGGSLGARRLNEAALGLAQALRERPDVAIYHVSGPREFDQIRAAADGALARPEAVRLSYHLVPYAPDLPELLAVCDLALCRAGASTVAELAAIGVAAVLVPLPGAPGDHQRRNAEGLRRAGAAVVVDDDAARPERLAPLVTELLEDRGRLAEMAGAARRLGHVDAADSIAALARELAGARGAGW